MDDFWGKEKEILLVLGLMGCWDFGRGLFLGPGFGQDDRSIRSNLTCFNYPAICMVAAASSLPLRRSGHGREGLVPWAFEWIALSLSRHIWGWELQSHKFPWPFAAIRPSPRAAVCCHPVCGTLLWRAWKTNTTLFCIITNSSSVKPKCFYTSPYLWICSTSTKLVLLFEAIVIASSVLRSLLGAGKSKEQHPKQCTNLLSATVSAQWH